MIRMHVVANSNSADDQRLKLLVRDAVIAMLQPQIEQINDVSQVREYLYTHLEQLESAANEILNEAGSTQRATVTLKRETFPVREYETFTLPSGVYESLRITIGEGEGRNWWCVVFPSFCIGAASADLRDTAAGAGFSDTLTDAVENRYTISFLFLDLVGAFENLFCFS